MKQLVCFDSEKLMKLLPNFEIAKIKTIMSDDDGSVARDYDYIALPGIEKITKSYGFWMTAVVKFRDGHNIKMYSSNVNSDDESLIRVEKNNIVSPKISITDGYIECNEQLENWLKVNGLDDTALDSAKEEISIYGYTEFIGVSSPVKMWDGWGMSSKPLVMSDAEIERVLNDISDEDLRRKVKCILTANIFKKKYYDE